MTPYQEAVLRHQRRRGDVAAQGGAPALVWFRPVATSGATVWLWWVVAGPVRRVWTRIKEDGGLSVVRRAAMRPVKLAIALALKSDPAVSVLVPPAQVYAVERSTVPQLPSIEVIGLSSERVDTGPMVRHELSCRVHGELTRPRTGPTSC